MKKIQNKLIELFNRYKHVWILSYFIIYLTWFGYLERTVTTHYHLIHLPIDDYIPFCEYFVIPYIMWFGYVAFGIAFTALQEFLETRSVTWQQMLLQMKSGQENMMT